MKPSLLFTWRQCLDLYVYLGCWKRNKLSDWEFLIGLLQATESSLGVFTWVDSFGQEVMEFLSSQNCLEVLCRHGGLEPERRDKCNRTAHDVATDDCKHLLENLSECPVQLRCLSCICNAGASGTAGKILMQLQFSHSLLNFHWTLAAIETLIINGIALFFRVEWLFTELLK